MGNTHENLQRREKVKGSSDRTFGLVIGIGFLIVALTPLLLTPHRPRWWALVLSIVFVLFALLWPQQLAVLNKLWLRFGLLLSRIVSPIVLGLLFYTTLLPVGFVMRLCGKDPLHLRPEPDRDSYWIQRENEASSHSMKQQF